MHFLGKILAGAFLFGFIGLTLWLCVWLFNAFGWIGGLFGSGIVLMVIGFVYSYIDKLRGAFS